MIGSEQERWPMPSQAIGSCRLGGNKDLVTTAPTPAISSKATVSDTFPVSQLTCSEISKIYHLPLPELLYRAMSTHRRYHDPCHMQLSELLSIKTGGCKEDCQYCPQSAHHRTPVQPKRLWNVKQVVARARRAQQAGAQRFCMGAAWSSPPKQGPAYESLLACAREVKKLGLEVCMTLGMIDAQQAQDLKEAGVDYYNHNLDTSPSYYKKIITTRTYEDRLRTLQNVRNSGMKVCCGGIIAMGESLQDRFALLEQLCALKPHPESVPINQYVKVPGTPLKADPDFEPLDWVRMIATTRMALPKSVIRLSAGRSSLSREAQTLCFLAGAGSIFVGDVLLTTPNSKPSEDLHLLKTLGIHTSASSSSSQDLLREHKMIRENHSISRSPVNPSTVLSHNT